MVTSQKVILACPRVPEAVALASGRLGSTLASDVASHVSGCRACLTTLRLCEEALRLGRLPAAYDQRGSYARESATSSARAASPSNCACASPLISATASARDLARR